MAPTVKDNLRPIPPASEICYFLGAGFSAASRYRLPTAEGFLSPDALIYCCNALNQKGTIRVSDHPDLPQLLSRLEARYGELRSLDLESIMSDLYERSAGIGQPWSTRDPALVDRELPFKASDLRRIRPDGIPLHPAPEGSDLGRDYQLLLLYICLRLRVPEGRDDECPLVQALLETQRVRDSIVTLNYDTIIEHHRGQRRDKHGVWDPRVDVLHYYLGLPSPGHQTGPRMLQQVGVEGRGFYAKLHGSLNWRSCPRPICPNHWYIESTDRPGSDAAESSEAGRCSVCGSLPETVIIPPVATKPFDRFPKLRLMWLQAFRALSRAPRWVFIGVSFAPTDMQLRSLVRAASEDWFPTGIAGVGQVCVVNKGDKGCHEAADRLWECLSPRVQRKLSSEAAGIATFASIEDYLGAVQSTDGHREPDPVC
jgi:hypothetical protein